MTDWVDHNLTLVQWAGELPNRTSPEEYPEMFMLDVDELNLAAEMTREWVLEHEGQHREALPQRRRSETMDFSHVNASYQSFAYKATVGFYDDGRPGEVFLNAAKITTDMDTSARDAAVLLSFALQHGADMQVMRTSMQRDPSGRPLGVIGTLLDILSHPVQIDDGSGNLND